MWVTQTYLGTPDSDASIFVYYLYENYDEQQIAFTKLVQEKLGVLGEIFKSDVTLLVPNPDYAASIQSEFVERFRALWSSFAGKLPGLIVTQKPMNDPEVLQQESIYFAFNPDDPESVSRVCDKLRTILLDQLSDKHAKLRPPSTPTLFERLWYALEVKPGGLGIRLDVKKLASSTGGH